MSSKHPRSSVISIAKLKNWAPRWLMSVMSPKGSRRVLDDVIGQLRGQTNLGLGSKDYVEGVLKRALGPEKRLLYSAAYFRLHQARPRNSRVDDAIEYLRDDWG